MVLDLHVHSDASDDSRATVTAYLAWLARRRPERPIDGLVLTEHRQFDPDRDVRSLEDQFGVRLFRGAEIETDYGHMLVFGVTRAMLARIDFADVRLPAQSVITEIDRMGGVVLPCHPGRPNVGLCAHYDARGPLDGVVAIEAINGGSRPGEDAATAALMRRHGYPGFGGSDAHMVSFVGLCATEFFDRIDAETDLVAALRASRFRAVDYRGRHAAGAASPVAGGEHSAG
jgi:predicted metal-dependent phosphoesterase TrpH